MNSSLGGLSAKQFRQAARLKERIEALQAQVDRILRPLAAGAPRGRKRGRRATARRRTAARGRWARTRGPVVEKTAQPRSRRLSTAGRAKLSASARARWATAKAQGRSRL